MFPRLVRLDMVNHGILTPNTNMSEFCQPCFNYLNLSFEDILAVRPQDSLRIVCIVVSIVMQVQMHVALL